MRYVFGFSLLYQKYKNNAVIRVFADNYLVDEITLDRDIGLKTVKYDSLYIFGDDHDDLENTLQTPEKLFMFHIDDKFLKKEITLQIKNKNTNYTNGFMTQWSHVQFHDMFLIPNSMLNQKIWKTLKHRFNERFPVEKSDFSKVWPNAPTLDMLKIENSTTEWTGSFLFNPRGGDFTVRVPLSKKHKVIHLGKVKTGMYRLMSRVPMLLRVFNALNTSK